MRPLLVIACLLTSALPAPADEVDTRVRERTTAVAADLGDGLLTTADEVIAAHVAAIGGASALRAVKTLAFRGRMQAPGPAERYLHRYYRQPDQLRVTWSPGGGAYTLCDGGEVWSVTPAGRRKQAAWWARSLSHSRIDGNFLDYAERGIAHEYLGLEGFASDLRVYYRLRRTFPDGFVEDLYFDVETGLLHGVRPLNTPRQNDPMFYYDYRDVGGILVPHMWARTFAGADPPHVLVMEEVRIDVDFDDGFFTDYLELPVLD